LLPSTNLFQLPISGILLEDYLRQLEQKHADEYLRAAHRQRAEDFAVTFRGVRPTKKSPQHDDSKKDGLPTVS
jgi:hypothetical protein